MAHNYREYTLFRQKENTTVSKIKGNVEPSLPQITGYVSFGACYIDEGSGAFRYTSTTYGVQNTEVKRGFHDDFDFNSSRCSSVYNRTDYKVYPMVFIAPVSGITQTCNIYVPHTHTSRFDMKSTAQIGTSNTISFMWMAIGHTAQ